MAALQVVSVLGFRLPFYKTPTLLLSLGLSVRVLWYLILSRPDVIHASSPGALLLPHHVSAAIRALLLCQCQNRLCRWCQHASAAEHAEQALTQSVRRTSKNKRGM